MMNCLATGDPQEADRLASRIERVVAGCFEVVRDYPAANPFTNANKLLDHIMAFGRDAREHAPPYLHGGQQLPRRFVEQAYQIVAEHELVPSHGYLEG